MGLSQSQVFTHKYLNHPLFGQVLLDQSLQNDYHCVTIEATYELSDLTPVDRWLNALNCQFDGIRTDEKDGFYHFTFDKEYENQQDHYQSLLMPIKYSWRKQGLFGKGGVLKHFQVHFQAFIFSFQQEIEGRVNSGKTFNETQLWFFLFKLVKMQYHFEQKHKKIGNIHPQNILINSSFQLKVFGKYSSIEGKDNFESKSHNIKAKAFPAPEQLEGINNREKLYLNQKQNIAEMFSIGLTVLCAATLSSGDQFYNVDESNKTLEMRLCSIEERLESLQEKYSSFLYNLMTKILAPNCDERISASHLYLSLKQYEVDILQMRPFLPELSKSTKPNPKELSKTTSFSRTSFTRTLTQFESQVEEYKRKLQYRQQQQRKLHSFYRKFKY